MPEMLKKMQGLSPVKQALIEIRELKAKISRMEEERSEPVAIVGAGVRFPGGADDLQSFWQILAEGKDTITETPKDRWNLDKYFDPDPDAPGKMYTKFGGYINDIDKFDAGLFGISEDEVLPMDPQHRLLLEVTWTALEQAGIAPDKLKGSNTGVYIGISAMDNFIRLVSDQQSINPHYAIGNLYSAAAGRISYVLGLRGPSMALDTACSSSLVAVHNACLALRNSECDMAIAGGVSLMLTPHLNINFSRARMIAKDGRCKTFDKDADGYIRGEGCGVIILKRLSDALAANDNILAMVRGSAVNHVGRSSGITAPNGPAQEMVITNALKNAGVDPADVDYLEAHGTGTTLGDPIEVQALASVFGRSRLAGHPLLIGTVKTNIGHLEAASGIAGMIKVILAMQHEQIPRHLNFNTPNPLIRWEEIPIKVSHEPVPWEKNERTRIAGVSSFGFSGTNSHIILQEPPLKEYQSENKKNHSLNIFTISAKNEEGLKQLADRYISLLTGDKIQQENLNDICYSANAGRAHLDKRVAVLAESHQQLLQKLASWKSAKQIPGLYENNSNYVDSSKIAFLFPSDTSQWIQTGRDFYANYPLFKKIIKQCADIIHSFSTLPPVTQLFKQNEQVAAMADAQFVQQASFCFYYALAQLWRSWGVEPAVVMGHGRGEIVAACIAGIFNLEDGLKIAAGQHQEIPLKFLKPRLEIISSATGHPAVREMSSTEYWEGPVSGMKTDEGISELLRQHYSVFLEIGPDSQSPEKIEQIKAKGALYVSSYNPGTDGWQHIYETIAVFYTCGMHLNWLEFYKDYPGKRIDLPLYPFHRQSYWINVADEGSLASTSKTNKIDYKMLAFPKEKNHTMVKFVAPRNSTEKKIADIWKGLLHIEKIGIHDNFFDLGGQSVQTMQISLEIERTFGKKLPLAALFPTPTIEKLAEALQTDVQKTPFHSLVPLQPEGSQIPVFGIHSTRYYTLSQYLGNDQPFYALRFGHASENSEDILSLPDNIEELAASYITEMQMIQPHGPYNLIGLCIGALVAFEIANQLVEKGEQVAMLILADPVIKGSKKSIPLGTKVKNLRQIGTLKALNRLRKKAIRKLQLAKGKRSNRAQFKYSDYMPQKVYPGKAVIIKTVGNVTLSSIFDPELGWKELAGGGLEIHEIKSSHTGVLEEPAVQNVADLLKKYLARQKNSQISA